MIFEFPNVTKWKNQLNSAFCWYDNNNNNNDATYGKLYNWFAIEESRGICPAGWHMPSDSEFAVLTKYLGSADDVAGGRLKEEGTTHLDAPNEAASNSSEFTGLPGGMHFQEGQFNHMGKNGLFSSSRRESESLAFFTLHSITIRLHHTELTSINEMVFSCRCVKD